VAQEGFKFVNKSSSVIWQQPHCHPHGTEWTRPLCVLLSVQCLLQTSPITQPPVRYIHTAQTDTWRWHIPRKN